VSEDYRGPDPGAIRTMFGAIASRYDRANDVLSGGIHRRWRRRAVKRSEARPGQDVLDCATGTGDLAIAFRRALGPGGRVVGTDFVPQMIELAREKGRDLDIAFDVADVMALPFDDASFDIASIAFGIRNVSDPRLAIRELARVLRPGGRVIILEFGQPPNRAFRALYDFYSARVLPRLGGLVTGDRAAYEYLERSASRFPCGEEFAQMMRESGGFASVDYEALTFGIAYLYRGEK
jgi:demethylmenaquinone methyltransferase/2-methoxy-6-polyprenyl-1,4-benzoquinol methylase